MTDIDITSLILTTINSPFEQILPYCKHKFHFVQAEGKRCLGVDAAICGTFYLNAVCNIWRFLWGKYRRENIRGTQAVWKSDDRFARRPADRPGLYTGCYRHDDLAAVRSDRRRQNKSPASCLLRRSQHDSV